MEEQGVIWTGVFDQPVHGAENVLLGRLAHGILLVVSQDDHVLSLVAKVLSQVARHVADIVDAAAQLAALAKVIDADEKSLSPAGALGIAKRVVLGSAAAKVLGCARRLLGAVLWTALGEAVSSLRRRSGTCGSRKSVSKQSWDKENRHRGRRTRATLVVGWRTLVILIRVMLRRLLRVLLCRWWPGLWCKAYTWSVKRRWRR